ncbi:DUF3488 and transglutaminase-like domain-containing protein, partial [Thauera aminoaromatica]
MPSLRRDQVGWLLAGSALTLAPHASHLPPAISALCALLLVWRGFINQRGSRLPHRSLLVLMAAGVVGAVLLEFHQFFGKEPGIALLAGLLSLKLLETDSLRDARAAVLLSFFMQLGQFLYQQNMAIAALALLGTFASIGTLLALQGRAEAFAPRAAAAARLLLQALPLMLVLFLLFPRVQGPLWGLPADAHSAVSGLSDDMRPGDIARVSESGAIAFRAAFEGDPPPPAERYWRGPVLTRFDGHSWRPGPSRRQDQPFYQSSGIARPYTLTLEPHNQHWLLAMDFPGPAGGLVYGDDFRLLSREPVRSRLRLELVAHPATPVGLAEDPRVLQEALALPPGFNPRTRALGERLRAAAGHTEDIPALAIRHFRDSRLAYTLAPAPLSRDDVDSFLFDTRQGFCEHFAAAFVVAMRAAGVPARVVTGYQGGEINPVDGTLVVRQSDAHAWAEVWLEARGWLRVDPTAASAPRRIDGGVAAALPDTARLPLLARSDLPWLRALRDRVDAVNNRWNQWVLGYNPARQRELVASLGFGDTGWQSLTALMAGGTSIVMGGLTLWALRRVRPGDAIDRSWSRVCRRLAAAGHPRHAWEGPLDYAGRIASEAPETAPELASIAADYARLRYGPAPADAALLPRFLHTSRKFRP